jgi:hypothetical protein
VIALLVYFTQGCNIVYKNTKQSGQTEHPVLSECRPHVTVIPQATLLHTCLILSILFRHRLLLGLPFTFVPVILEPDFHLKHKMTVVSYRRLPMLPEAALIR